MWGVTLETGGGGRERGCSSRWEVAKETCENEQLPGHVSTPCDRLAPASYLFLGANPRARMSLLPRYLGQIPPRHVNSLPRLGADRTSRRYHSHPVIMYIGLSLTGSVTVQANISSHC